MNMPAASHHSLLHAAFIVSTDAGLREQDDDEDHSLVYSYPPAASAGSTGGFVKSFSSLIVTVRGALDSICGEKTRLVYLEHGGRRLLLASAHLESMMLVLALRSVVPPGAATSLALNLAETLVLLLGPCTDWGLLRRGGSASNPGLDPEVGQMDETRAILDRIFEGVLSQVDSPSWGPRMAPWTSFEPSCLHLALPPPLHTRLSGLLADHWAQRSRAHFSFFRKHSCLMYRGLILASDLQPPHAKQLWHLLWALGLHQHSAGLPCQVLTRIVHLPQLQLQLQSSGGAATAAAAASGAAGRAAAAAAVALQAESGVTVSEQQMGRSLLVVAAAMRLVLVLVLTAYDEEIEEELTGRLEGHAAAELLQRIHLALGADLERLVEGSAIYGSAARALESPPPSAPHTQRSEAGTFGPGAIPPAAVKQSGGGGGSLLFRVITRNRSSPQQRPGSPDSGGGGGTGGGASGGPRGRTGSMSGGREGGSAGGSTLRTGPGTAREGAATPAVSPSVSTGSQSGSPPRLVPRSNPNLAITLPPGHPITASITNRTANATPGSAAAGPASAPSGGSGGGSPPAPSGGAAGPPSATPHDRGPPNTAANVTAGPGGGSGGGGGAGGGGWPRGTGAPSHAGGIQPVGSPFDGVSLLIAHDVPHGCVRFLGDVPGGGAAPGPLGEAALAAVWRAVAACRARFGLHNVAVAAPPKHARLTMTLDQILQLSAARSNKLGGQRLGTADSSPWQYHPELASLAAVNTVTLRLPLPSQLTATVSSPGAGVGAGAGAGGAASGDAAGGGRAPSQQPPGSAAGTSTAAPTAKSWLSRLSGSRRSSSGGGGGGGGGGSPNSPDIQISSPPDPTAAARQAATTAAGGSPPGASGPFATAAAAAAAASSPEPATPKSGRVPALSGGVDSLSLSLSGGTTSGLRTSGGAGAAVGYSQMSASTPGAPSGASSSGGLYLTGLLFPDTREVYVCHSSEVDEVRLAEVIWEAASGFGAAGPSGGAAGGVASASASGVAELWAQDE